MIEGSIAILRLKHVLGLGFSIGAGVCLAGLWVYGLPYLQGTFVEDLSLLVYLAVAIVFLSVADRVARALIRH